MSALRPLGLKGRSALHRPLSLARRATMPPDYQPGERSHPNLQYARHWRDQPGSSCVGHGTGQGYEIGKVRWGGSALEPVARLHLYTQGLLQQTLPGQHLQDEGTFIDYVLAPLTQVGVCAERLFPPTVANVAKRPSIEAEAEGLERADGEFWQIHGTGDEHVRQVAWAIDTFGAVIVGKLVGNVYADHQGDGLLAAPSANEVWLGGHCTVLAEHRNHATEFIELGSWSGWGYSRGIIGSDGVTRQIHSLARVSSGWLKHPWHMNAYVFVPSSAKEAA